jgi:hypothetical protein
MTAVKERLFVLGGDNEMSKMDDSSAIFILDSTKIKYPSDTPQQQPQPVESLHPQQAYDTTEEMNGMSQQQYYQQQQQPQPQPQQYQYQQPYHQSQHSQHSPGQAPLQQSQNPGQYSPQLVGQKPFVDQRQPQRPNPPNSPVQQHQARSLVGAVMNVNGHKELDTSMNYSDIQPSPTSSSGSPSPASPRHRSYYPEGQSPTQVLYYYCS